jgi:hypothetical protein
MINREYIAVNDKDLNWGYFSMVSFVAVIGGLLFGFDTGVIAGTKGLNL